MSSAIDYETIERENEPNKYDWESTVVSTISELEQRISNFGGNQAPQCVVEIGAFVTPQSIYSATENPHIMHIACESLPSENTVKYLDAYADGNNPKANNWIYYEGDIADISPMKHDITGVILSFPGQGFSEEDGRYKYIQQVLSINPEAYIVITAESKYESALDKIEHSLSVRRSILRRNKPVRKRNLDPADYHKEFPMTYFSRLIDDEKITVLEINPSNKPKFQFPDRDSKALSDIISSVAEDYSSISEE